MPPSICTWPCAGAGANFVEAVKAKLVVRSVKSSLFSSQSVNGGSSGERVKK